MRTILAAIHVTFASLWLGCILTEALFERALLPKGRGGQLTLAHLHVRVDKVVEIPAILGVLVTGILMLSETTRTSVAFQFMLLAGAIAIAANFYCVWLVFKRRDAAVAGNWLRFEALDHIQHKAGGAVLVAVLIGLVAGYWSRIVA